MFSLLPSHGPDGHPIRLAGVSGEMIFPGTLRTTVGISPEMVAPILEAGSHYLLEIGDITPDDNLKRLCGVGLDRIDAIGAFEPCTFFIGDFASEDVHTAWTDLGYAPVTGRDIWSWKGLSRQEMDGDTLDTLLIMQQRLSLPRQSRGRYRFLTCIDDRVIVEAESEDMLERIRDLYSTNGEGSVAAALGSVPATIGHAAKLYEDDGFATLNRAASGRAATLQEENHALLASIEDEMGRMPRVRLALLGITPGGPWDQSLEGFALPETPSSSLAYVHLDSADDAARYLAIATARFEGLKSWYTEMPYSELFSFEGHASGSQVSIHLGHLRAPRYDILQMSYFDDLAFLTWEPDNRDTWRSAP
jgi:hypothetical protein